MQSITQNIDFIIIMGMCLTKADGLLDSGTPISKKTVDEEREMHCNEAE